MVVVEYRETWISGSLLCNRRNREDDGFVICNGAIRGGLECMDEAGARQQVVIQAWGEE